MAIWVIWHALFGLFATLAPKLGARISGWSPASGWSADLLAMSTQYGMVMLLLAGVYAFVVSEPVRYRDLLWVAVSEQVLGLIYAVYIFSAISWVAPIQLLTQALINLALVGLLLTVMVNLRAASPGALPEKAQLDGRNEAPQET